MTLVHALNRHNTRYGLASLCLGGNAVAMIVERVTFLGPRASRPLLLHSCCFRIDCQAPSLTEQRAGRPQSQEMAMPPIVLMLEDDVERLDRFEAVAAKLGIELVVWADARRMIAELSAHLLSAALISLDHDLVPIHDIEPGDGLDVAKHLATLPPVCPVIVHTSNGVRGDAIIGELELAGWIYHRVPPIGDDWIEVDWLRTVKRALKARR